MRLIDITQIPDDQYMDFLRWFSMKNPEVSWNTVFLDRLSKKGGKVVHVDTVMKKLLVDPEGLEFLSVYRSSIICPVQDGKIQVMLGASYSLESRYEAEKELAPDHVMVLVESRIDADGGRRMLREDRPLASLPLEPAPPLTAEDIQWSKEEMARREIEKATAEINQRLGINA